MKFENKGKWVRQISESSQKNEEQFNASKTIKRFNDRKNKIIDSLKKIDITDNSRLAANTKLFLKIKSSLLYLDNAIDKFNSDRFNDEQSKLATVNAELDLFDKVWA